MKTPFCILCLCLLCTFKSWGAYDYEVDGIYYNLYRTELEVTCGEKKYQQKEMVIPAHVTIDGREYKVISIGSDAFRDNGFIESVTLPNTIEFIRSYSFKGSTLKSINLPESLWNIETGAFERTNLREINIPSGINTIEEGVFHGCIYLHTVILPKTLSYIKTDAFASTGLTAITIPEKVFSIGLNAFQNTTLAEIYCLAPEPPHTRHPHGTVYGFPFSNDTYENATVYVPEEYLAIYMDTSHWGKKDTFIPGEEYAYFRKIKGFDPAGISDVTNDDSKATIEVYTIQGIRIYDTIPNLSNGIYIIRQGKTTKKVIINNAPGSQMF